MDWLAVFADPLLRSTLLAFWLLPCAIQDRRTRHVSNWLTVPLFVLAWPAAFLTGHLALTFAVFIGVYVATKLEPRAGAADGKLMVGLAAFAPLALGIGALLEVVVFVVLRVRGRRRAAIPGALWLYVGSLLSAVVWAILAVVGARSYL
jgi:Flp pilus assembly protein protease CpaA